MINFLSMSVEDSSWRGSKHVTADGRFIVVVTRGAHRVACQANPRTHTVRSFSLPLPPNRSVLLESGRPSIGIMNNSINSESKRPLLEERIVTKGEGKKSMVGWQFAFFSFSSLFPLLMYVLMSFLSFCCARLPFLLSARSSSRLAASHSPACSSTRQKVKTLLQ